MLLKKIFINCDWKFFKIFMISLNNIDHVMTAPSVLLSVVPATMEFESCYQHSVRRLKNLLTT